MNCIKGSKKLSYRLQSMSKIDKKLTLMNINIASLYVMAKLNDECTTG